MTALAPLISPGKNDVKIGDTYAVFLKKELVPTKEVFDRHIRWLEEEILKDDTKSRLKMASFIDRIECMYKAELSKQALRKIRQREE